MQEYAFKQGDRVTRPVDVYDYSKGFREGTVLLRYKANHTIVGQSYFYPELYAVLWDSGKVEKAFLPHGLTLAREVGSDYWLG